MITTELQRESIIHELEDQLAKAKRDIAQARSVICVVCYEKLDGSFYNETGWAGPEGLIKTSLKWLVRAVMEQSL